MPTSSRHYMALCVCAAVGAGAAGFAAASLFPLFTKSQPLQAIPPVLEPSDPQYREVMCGPVSLSVALARVGVSAECSPADLAARCTVTSRGVALSDLERAAKNFRRVSADTQRLSWDELRRLDGAVVLFVKGNHYIAVDPRESPPTEAVAGRVRVYEPERPAQWWTRESLEAIWGGDAIVLTRRSTDAGGANPDPHIEWSECLVDQGVVRNVPSASYRFSCRNVGRGDLLIGDVQTSCGCIAHAVSRTRIPPGESAVFQVDVDLDRIEGYFQQSVLVKTNDPSNPASVLRMAGGVPRSRVISTDLIHLEDLPHGGKVYKTFYVADPGFGGVVIPEARYAPRGGPGVDTQPACSVSCEILGTDAMTMRVGFRLKPGDYAVRLVFDATAACPPGPFQGEVELALDAEGVVTRHKVAVHGTVVPDVYPIPRMGLIALDPAGTGSTTIQLRSHSKRPFAVVNARSAPLGALEVTKNCDAADGSPAYLISARGMKDTAGAGPSKQSVSFELADGSTLSVPVTVFTLSR